MQGRSYKITKSNTIDIHRKNTYQGTASPYKPSENQQEMPKNKIQATKRRSLHHSILSMLSWIKQIAVSAIIVSILLFILFNFYIFASIVDITTFLYVFLLFSLLTDGLFILFQLLRRKVKHEELECDPTKLTIVIACYNGADVIGETIRQAKNHVPAKQIIVVSDASTDNTAIIARELGTTVIENKHNISKVFSINRAMASVETPYVLLLDDDVLIGDITIPTSLLDDGYTAVAFNVMPVQQDNILTKLQVFEYRNSMQIGKNLRGKVGAIGNISGAIGLYRTKDLEEQIERHSGQFAGEDEQRTILAHLYGKGKGITYTDQTVVTHVPDTVKSLYRQRAYSWSLAVPELFFLYWRMLFSPKYHYLLKAEKAYYLYIYLTDPLRVLFIWALVIRPAHVLVAYGFYLVFNTMIWIRTKAKDGFSIILIYPLYKLMLAFCRFIGNFYWFRAKAKYFRNNFHKVATRRRLLPEYAFVAAVFMTLWAGSTQHFMQELKLYNQIRTNRLENPIKAFEYEDSLTAAEISTDGLNILYKTSQPEQGTYVAIGLEQGDTARAIAHKAVGEFIASRTDIVNIPYEQRMEANYQVLLKLSEEGAYLSPIGSLFIEIQLLENAITSATSVKPGGINS
jgi:cellulose synthase/poly-beta-1,6-N-acetylglucosamine synthase-like glycosyltransferase